MGFSISNMGLALAIAESLREIKHDLFHAPAPGFLHHYTKSAATVESIVQSGYLWATCIADQSDQTEISHAAELVARVAEEIQNSEISEFSTDVLRRLPFFMEERKRWIFIACFCDDSDSDLHWREYGDYRLTFPSPWSGAPSLTLSDIRSECWYQRVIYDKQAQQDAIERSLRSIVRAISGNTSGRNEGPWAKAMVDSCARNTAQLLLGLAVGFKRSSFRDEKEWRVVCAPPLGTNGGSPTLSDENFGVNIRRVPRSHVLLQIQRKWRIFEPLLMPPVPFLDWAWNPNRANPDAVERVNAVLRANDRADLVRSFGSRR